MKDVCLSTTTMSLPRDFLVGPDHVEEDQTIVMVHPEDLDLFDGKYILLQAERRHKTLVWPVKQESVGKEMVRLSKRIKENLQVHIGDRIRIFPVTIGKHRSVSIFPVADQQENRDWNEEFLNDFFRDKLPYPVHVEDVIEIVSKNNERMEFMVSKIDQNNEGYALIERETAIDVNGITKKSQLNDIRRRIGFGDLGGVDEALEQVRLMVEAPLTFPELFDTIQVDPPNGILLYGPSGTGKTNIARAVATEIGAYFHIVNGPEILGKFAGESEENLRKAFEECKKQAPSILFFDEIDAIAPKRDKTQGDLEKRIVSQLLTLMNGLSSRGRVAVLAATNRPNSIDPALRRFGRFDKEIEVGVPDQSGRLKILQIKTRRLQNVLADDVDLEEMAADCHGYVGADLEALVAEAGQRCILRTWKKIQSEDIEKRRRILQEARVTAEDFKIVMEKLVPSALREKLVETPKVDWSAIGGLADVKKNIQQMIQFPIQHADQYEKFRMSPSRGVLFYGPPGCGKTLLAKAAARMCNANFISVKGPELLAMWLGESEANVRELFDRARSSAPCILFFDEIDSIAPKRGNDVSGATDRVLNQLLTELDGVGHNKNVFVIGATNRPDSMDSAVLRPGRLDQLIYIPLPDKDARLQILRTKFGVDVETGDRSRSTLSKDVDLDFLAEYTIGFSGADLSEVCSRSVQCAIKELVRMRENAPEDQKTKDFVPVLTKNHFEEAMKYARRSVTVEEERAFEIFRNSKGCEKEFGTETGFKFKKSPENEGNGEGGDLDDGYS